MSTPFGVRATCPRGCTFALALLVAAALSACSGGGGGGSAASLTITADSPATVAGGSPVHLHAAGSGTPTWSLSGPGSLDATTGADVVYTPPATTPGNEAATATVTATTGASSKQLSITLNETDGPGHHWQVALAAGGAWRDVAFGNGLFVAVGQNGALASSADGRTWTPHDSSDHSVWVSVAYAASIGWVALGATGQVLTSPDGLSWTAQAALAGATDTVHFMNKIVYAKGVFVAAGDHQSFVSSDGVSWTPLAMQMHGLAFGGGVFVGAQGAHLASSADGKHWSTTLATTPTQSLGDVAFGNGVFVASDGVNLSVSRDGVTWTNTNQEAAASSIVFVDGRFYLYGSQLGSSSDGVTWTSGDRFWIRAGAVNASGSVVVGVRQDFSVPSYGDSLAAGASADNLATVAQGSYGPLTAVACSQVTCLALGESGVALASADHVTWTAGRMPTTQGLIYPTAIAQANALGTFIIGGSVYANGAAGELTQSAVFLSTLDGTDWLFATPPSTNEFNGEHLAFARGPQGWWSVSEAGEVDASPDGGTWTKQATLPGGLTMGVAYGGGRYVAVGWSGVAFASADGVTWTKAPPITAPGISSLDLNGVAYADGQFVAVCTHGKVATSTDGLAWTLHDSATTSDLYAVAVGADGEIIAVGDLGATQSSVDGVHWTSRATLTTRTLRSVNAIDGGLGGFIASGDDNFIEISTR